MFLRKGNDDVMIRQGFSRIQKFWIDEVVTGESQWEQRVSQRIQDDRLGTD